MPTKITVTSIVCQFNLPPVKFNPQAVQSCRASKWMEETKLQNHSKKWEIGRHANTTPSDAAKKTFGAVLLQSRWIYASGIERQNSDASWGGIFPSSRRSQFQAFKATTTTQINTLHIQMLCCPCVLGHNQYMISAAT